MKPMFILDKQEINSALAGANIFSSYKSLKYQIKLKLSGPQLLSTSLLVGCSLLTALFRSVLGR